ncbi:unnamed protein product [Closterium sp. NIES-53]
MNGSTVLSVQPVSLVPAPRSCLDLENGGAAGGGDSGGEDAGGAGPGGAETGGEGFGGADSRGADSGGALRPSGGEAVGAPTAGPGVGQ